MREIEILRLIPDCLVNQALGEHLFASEETVKSHVCHLLAKLESFSRSAADWPAGGSSLGAPYDALLGSSKEEV